MHGAAKGSPGREAADLLVLRELIGPALMRLKDMIESKDTPAPVLLAAIREVLDRTGYSEVPRLTIGQVEAEMKLLEAEGWGDTA